MYNILAINNLRNTVYSIFGFTHTTIFANTPPYERYATRHGDTSG
jgi:hypothetical protein